MCYTGKIAYVDLTTNTVNYGTIPQSVRKLYLGGRGLNSYYALTEIPAGVDPYSEDNVLIIGTGLLTGIKGIATSRCQISGKSPETGYYGDSNIGGLFPAAMKRCGFDSILIRGISPKPAILVIEQDLIRFLPAGNHWGKDTYTVQEDLRKEFGGNVHILCIGEAGENLVSYACIRSGKKSAAGRTGMGCLMGSKRLKAIVALNGKGKLNIASEEQYFQFIDELKIRFDDEPNLSSLKQYGTNWLYDLVNEGVHVGRTYNGLTNEFPDMVNIGPKFLHPFVKRRTACFSCPFGCRHTYEIKEGKYAGVTGEGPEYGILANFGPMLGITHIEPILAANDLINKWGIDSSTLGNLVAWAMELYDKGIITTEDTGGLKLEWGNDDAFIQLIEQITFRKGFGDILAQGAVKASEIIGHDSAKLISMIKNLPQSCATDMRFFRGFALGLATATRGADHLRSRPFFEPLELEPDQLRELYGTEVDQAKESYKGKSRVVQWWESYVAMFDVTGMCKLIAFTVLPGCFGFVDFSKLIRFGSGLSFEKDQVFDIGDRVTTTERLFIAREGVRRKDDTLPERFFEKLEWSTKTGEGFFVDREKFQTMLTEYYQWHGWDVSTGIPTLEKLSKLGILDVVSENIIKETVTG